MFCPSCGTQTEARIKYCKKCGQALHRLRGVMSRGGAGHSLMQNWADGDRDQLEEHREEQRRKQKKSPEEKRYDEIKGGVITTCIGVSATIFLYFLMAAVAHNQPHDAEIVSKIWLAGLIPTSIGLSLLFNALFVSPKIIELKRQQALADREPVERWTPVMQPQALDTASMAALPAANFEHSVTEHTTAKLKEKIAIPASRDTH